MRFPGFTIFVKWDTWCDTLCNSRLLISFPPWELEESEFHKKILRFNLNFLPILFVSLEFIKASQQDTLHRTPERLHQKIAVTDAQIQ